MKAQAGLKMAEQGYDLLDRKRKLLERELSALEKKKEGLAGDLRRTFIEAYDALKEANISMGIDRVEQHSEGVPEENGVEIKFYSVMGVEVPVVRLSEPERRYPSESMYKTNLSLDEAKLKFDEAKKLTVKLAELTGGIDRLAVNAVKTGKRANALKNIMIPRYKALIADISSSLEEKEREEFSRLKVIKRKEQNNG
jgi:V/A-type H+-transporting ATPase subunit D